VVRRVLLWRDSSHEVSGSAHGAAALPWGSHLFLGSPDCARYDIGADDLVRHKLGWRSFSFGRAERLDHRADAQLEDALAMATRVDAATVRRLRTVRDDGSDAGLLPHTSDRC
jgi:hypothetical protein